MLPFIVIWIAAAATMTTVAVVNSSEDEARAKHSAALRQQEEAYRRMAQEVQKAKADAENRVRENKAALLHQQNAQMSSILRTQVKATERLISKYQQLLFKIEEKIKNSSNEDAVLAQFKEVHADLHQLICNLKKEIRILRAQMV